MSESRDVVVVAGAGGFVAARWLQRAEVAVVIIDRHHRFQPLTYPATTPISSLGAIRTAGTCHGRRPDEHHGHAD